MHADAGDFLAFGPPSDSEFDTAGRKPDFTLDDIFSIPEDDVLVASGHPAVKSGVRSKAMSLDFILSQKPPEHTGSISSMSPSDMKAPDNSEIPLSYDSSFGVDRHASHPSVDEDTVFGWTPTEGEPQPYYSDIPEPFLPWNLPPDAALRIISVIALGAEASHFVVAPMEATALCPGTDSSDTNSNSNLTAPGSDRQRHYGNDTPATNPGRPHLLLPTPGVSHFIHGNENSPEAQLENCVHTDFWNPQSAANSNVNTDYLHGGHLSSQAPIQHPISATQNTFDRIDTASGTARSHTGSHPPPPRGGVSPALARSITHIRMARERAQHLERQAGRMHALPRDRVPSVMARISGRPALGEEARGSAKHEQGGAMQ
ncbi:hypothetical protein OBBRIDRAFT_597063 [Obba rivulosa]|uniref:Uncharacterized protein n=1 Tax=Obba rivulosa TaxID=1052685 RepID=A0A8E2B396_9APHY|nr:hypothetical protein OBBRIDRAFT_597063 [Obba rivulosa]